jgi:hypothetical protein
MVGAVRRAYNQAVVCKEAKDFDGAFKLYEEALAIRQHVYGTSSQVIGEQLYNMANARVLQGSRAGELLAGYRPPAARVWLTLLLFLHVRLTRFAPAPSDAAKLYTQAAAAFSAALG